jgi:hypothetical protein
MQNNRHILVRAFNNNTGDKCSKIKTTANGAVFWQGLGLNFGRVAAGEKNGPAPAGCSFAQKGRLKEAPAGRSILQRSPPELSRQTMQESSIQWIRHTNPATTGISLKKKPECV